MRERRVKDLVPQENLWQRMVGDWGNSSPTPQAMSQCPALYHLPCLSCLTHASGRLPPMAWLSAALKYITYYSLERRAEHLQSCHITLKSVCTAGEIWVKNKTSFSPPQDKVKKLITRFGKRLQGDKAVTHLFICLCLDLFLVSSLIYSGKS